MMGRPPKPTAVLKLQGTYDESRHGKRIDELANGEPIRPAWLDDEAAVLWNAVVAHLTTLGVAKEIDTCELAGMCRWWSIWRKIDREIEQESDKRHKLLIQASMAWKQFHAIASKFGMTPADRTKLQVESRKDDSDFMDLIAKSG